jgi:RsmE family RNA methyltransferase
MNLILLFEDDFVAGQAALYKAQPADQPPVGMQRVLLKGRRLEHVREIHRAVVGDHMRVGLVDGPAGTGHVRVVTRDRLELDVELDQAPPPALPVTLVLALPRPPVLRRVLISSVSMGIKRIVLLNAGGVEKSFWQSSAMQEAAVHSQIVLGLEQGRDTMLPQIMLRPRFRPFAEDELPQLAASGESFVAHPSDGISEARGCAGGLLAVGPEPGWSDYEFERLVNAGLRPFSLGPRPLRVESAVPALLGRLF